jgi:zinc transport system ATP-binding protein
MTLWERVYAVFVNNQNTVGASLLAKASGQSTYLLNDTPLSRASPLPQG